eukprot:6580295-Prorocentrum_lima.AAC.1
MRSWVVRGAPRRRTMHPPVHHGLAIGVDNERSRWLETADRRHRFQHGQGFAEVRGVLHAGHHAAAGHDRCALR